MTLRWDDHDQISNDPIDRRNLEVVDYEPVDLGPAPVAGELLIFAAMTTAALILLTAFIVGLVVFGSWVWHYPAQAGATFGLLCIAGWGITETVKR